MVATTNGTEYLYECMFLVDSGRYASDHEGVLNELTEMLEKAGGSVEVARPWQDGRLAYEIDGHRKGTHILYLLKMPGSGVSDLNRSVRLSDLVIRHLVIRHSETLYEAMTNALSPDAEIQRSA
ncbi:MAG: 30S ribosomal protein S6, partial [Planctomycetaceae bacterium]|nr:30S ribosomal protein S6 [Planctomycetaceae bacterium]